jgi:hypothetical protein
LGRGPGEDVKDQGMGGEHSERGAGGMSTCEPNQKRRAPGVIHIRLFQSLYRTEDRRDEMIKYLTYIFAIPDFIGFYV